MAKLPDEIVDVYPLSSGFLIQSQTPDNSINSIYLDIATKQTSQVPDLSTRLINFVPLENNFFIYKSSNVIKLRSVFHAEFAPRFFDF